MSDTTNFDVPGMRTLSRLLYRAATTLREVANTLERHPFPDVPEIDLPLISNNKISVRLRFIFQRAGVRTLRELASKSETDMLAIRNCGARSVAELRQMLNEHGLAFRKDGDS